MEKFVVDHFEEALRKNHIQVYYQPVIRTLSKRLCSFEGLARWVDPKIGVIRPDRFIPILEKHRLIHRLDLHIIRQVCARIRKNINEGNLPVPVSVNLSRLDFSLCDIFASIDEIVREYQISRDMLNIEITESIMAEQSTVMQSMLSRFRNAGFQIWMDDFGSGYSSLNILKDFSFDELKLDMMFLRSFDQSKSRRILASIIQMAKEIEIQTLAEGVETEEQFLFLRDIGCEKVQGFYFAQPMSYDDSMKHLQGLDIHPETPGERKYFNDIGSVNLLSAVPFMTEEERTGITTARQLNSIPLALIESHADHFSILFYNTAFEKTARKAGVMAGVLSQELLCKPQPWSVVPARFMNFMDNAGVMGEARMSFISHGEYYDAHARKVASRRGISGILVRLDNLSEASQSDRTSRLDEGIRQIYSMYDRVCLIDTQKNEYTPLYVAVRDDYVSTRRDIKKIAEEYARHWVVPEDRKGYLEFFDFSTLETRLQKTGKTNVSDYFRVYVNHGRYEWKRHTLLRYEPGIYLNLIRSADRELDRFQNMAFNDAGAKDGLSEELLWENLMSSGIVRVFWKDAERRFVGVSKGFLDYYGFESQEALRGNTDEDMGWHIRPDSYMNDELEVIHEGVTTKDVPGTCICKGENRGILASKTPVYDKKGKIIGLIGCFVDRELVSAPDKSGGDAKRRDILTGLLNSRGISEEAYAYQDQYHLRNIDFIRIHVKILDFASINRQYGFDFSDKMLAELGNGLRKVFGVTSAVGRYSGNQFVILQQIHGTAALKDIRKRINQIAAGIRQIDDLPITFYVSVGCAVYSETLDLEKQRAAAEERMAEDQKKKEIQADIIGSF